MPPSRPASPLSLETCSPPISDLCFDGIIGSDDELDEKGRVAQRQRIEKQAKACQQSKPLFILSASLRGPLDSGWVNPWKKDRRPTAVAQGDRRPDKRRKATRSPVIEETLPHKRRQHPKSDDTRDAKHSVALPNETDSSIPVHDSRIDFSNDQDNRTSKSPGTRKRSLPWMRKAECSPQSYRPTPVKHMDGGWLKKDRKRMELQNIDPPTSPTRHLETRPRPAKVPRGKVDQPKDSSLDRGFRTSKPYASHISSHNPAPIEASTETRTSKSPKAAADATNSETSLLVLSSTSHLPKFEYCRRTNEPLKRISPVRSPTGLEETKEEESAGNVLRENDELQAQQDLSQSVTLNHASNTIENVSSSNLGNTRSNSNPQGTDTMEKIPSAQQVSGNPVTSGYTTSLHSIALTKSHPEGDGPTDQDPQFSTQAALLLAQRSFQEDLESQEAGQVTSQRQPRPSPYQGPEPTNVDKITPFRRLNTPGKDKGTDLSKAPDTAVGPVLSTQYMLNATTPFTFSTERKSTRHGTFPLNQEGEEGNPPPVNPEISTPSPDNAHLETSKSLIERVPDSMPRHSPDTQSHALETQPSLLPLTLTGTTPPTAQDGQGVYRGPDSFNLSQAIADAGSWLQQSFDWTRDLKNSRHPNSRPASSRNTQRSAAGGKKYGLDLA